MSEPAAGAVAVSPAVEQTVPAPPRFRPLTERVLGSLPGPRPLWLIAWSAVALLLTAGAIRRRWLLNTEISDTRIVLWFAVAVSISDLVALVGIGRLSRDVASLSRQLTTLSATQEAVSGLFRRIGWRAGPLAMTGLLAVAYWGRDLARGIGFGHVLGILGAAVAALPFATLVWSYVVILVDLNRLGRMDLRLRPFEEDRSLGLRPVGGVAFAAFWVLLLSMLPVFPFAAIDEVTAAITTGVVLVGIGLLFLSLNGLHRQVTRAKRGHMKRARELYAAAFRPAWTEGTPEALAGRASAISSAESIERRAASIQEWPIDDNALRTLLVIATSVVAGLLVRILTGLFGL